MLFVAGHPQRVHAGAAIDSYAVLGSNSPAHEQLYLEVFINRNRVPGLHPFERRSDGLWAHPMVLHQIGFKRLDENQTSIKVDSIPGTEVHYDVAGQTVSITADMSQLALSRTLLEPARSSAPDASVGTGILLNYDLYSTYRSAGAASLNAATELRAFSPYGVLENSMLSTLARGSGASSRTAHVPRSYERNVRLDTNWTTSWPDKAISLSIGDTTTGNLLWTRATRIAGVRLGRNFRLQPYTVTAPLPAFMGSAVLPSAVDLYIDGVKRYNGHVPAGPFQLNGLPQITGMGNAQVVLTDVLGRRTQVDIPFYTSSRLLAPGISDWSTEVGYVRKEYGRSSFSYATEPVASGTIRYGVSDSLTAEAHAEGTRGTNTGGIGAVATLGVAGQISGSYSRSQNDRQGGSQYSLGYQWQNRNFNFGTNVVRADSAYRDVASAYGSPAPARSSESVVIGTSLKQLGMVNVSYVHTRYPGEHSNRYAGVYWSKSIGKGTVVSASYTGNLNVPQQQTVFFGLSILLGNNVNLSTSARRANGEAAYGFAVRQSTLENSGWSWSLQGQQTSRSRSGYAEADYRGKYGEYRFGLDTSNYDNSAFAGASGSFVLLGGRGFAGRRVNDGFAVVSTSRIPDVPVKLQNNPVGRTDSMGMLMVSPIAPYQANLISIDPMDLPLNMRIDRVNAEVATEAKSGALVTFDIRPLRAATVILHDRAGQPLPVGALVHLNGGIAPVRVGYDGMTYLEDLKDQNFLTVRLTAETCYASFSYHSSADIAVPVGPLLCE